MPGGAGIVGQAPGADPLADPMSQRIQQLLQRRALRTAANARRRGAVLTSLAGLNPMQARGALLGIERGAAGDLSSNLSEAALSGLQRDQDWQRQLHLGQLSFERQRALQQAQERAMRRAQGGIGSRLGTLAGTLGGAYLGGPGGAQVGSWIGRGIRRIF
jgi:hypothetical protein